MASAGGNGIVVTSYVGIHGNELVDQAACKASLVAMLTLS